MEFNNKLEAEKRSILTGRGYWSVNNKFFFNKAECLKYASETKQYDVSFNFMDSIYNILDWSKEPEDSLDVMYRIRAEQIRSSYDYVILFFSGGADSTNILDTFLDNNIFIDEIVSFYPVSMVERGIDSFSAVDKSKENIIFEYVMATKPKLKELQSRSPMTKITIIDDTEKTVDFILSGNMNKVFQGGIAADPFHVSHYHFLTKMQSISEGKKICAVTGFDKPRIMYDMHKDKFALYFLDFVNIFGNFSEKVFDSYNLPRIEHFYFSPLFPTMVQKQCFLLEKKLRSANMLDENSCKHILINVKNNRFLIYDSHTDFFKAVIYPKWNSNLWQAEKDLKNQFFQSQSHWFHDFRYTNQRERDYYAGQINELISGISHHFIEGSENRVSKFKDFFSAPIWF